MKRVPPPPEPSPPVTIRPLAAADAEAYRALRLRMLTEHPEAFGASAEAFAREDEALYRRRFQERTEGADTFIQGAFLEARLVGTAGIHRGWGEKEAHKAMLWGMYVAPEARRRGIGRGLVDAALALAAASFAGLEQVQLGVATENEAARRLYATLGFEPYGLERAALKLGERAIDVQLMVRFL